MTRIPGERGTRLRAIAKQLRPKPQVPPFYLANPDPLDGELRALGWYMRRTRKGPAVYLGHSAAAAEVFLCRELDRQRGRRRPGKQARKPGQGTDARA